MTDSIRAYRVMTMSIYTAVEVWLRVKFSDCVNKLDIGQHSGIGGVCTRLDRAINITD
jgi:hypothetical protein